MRIGIDCRLYSPTYTGIGRYVFELVKNLIELDQENHYVLYFNQPEFDQFQVPNERWQKKLVNIPHYSLAEQTRFHFFLKQEPIDLVHFTHFNAPVLYTKPFVVTIHDLTLHYYPYKEYNPKGTLKKKLQIMIYRFIMGQVTKHAKHIIAVSENTKKDLMKEYALNPEKITTVYEGVADAFSVIARNEAISTPGNQIAAVARLRDSLAMTHSITKPYLIYTGVWRSHKNLLKLIEAFKLLVDAGNDVQLVITGKKDPAYPEIPALIEQLKLQDRVILTGFVDDSDLVSLMSGAQVYVFPSLYEGFGLPPLEAMALGVPVASSNTSSLPEVCGDAALYFDPNNVQDMADKIGQYLKNPQLREEMIMKGRKNLERFSWKKMAGEILKLYT